MFLFQLLNDNSSCPPKLIKDNIIHHNDNRITTLQALVIMKLDPTVS